MFLIGDEIEQNAQSEILSKVHRLSKKGCVIFGKMFRFIVPGVSKSKQMIHFYFVSLCFWVFPDFLELGFLFVLSI